MKKTHDVASRSSRTFYGQPIRHSYYLGSSQGGREALMVVQRFPQDYDGVFAQVPAHPYVQLSIGDPLRARSRRPATAGSRPRRSPVIAKEVLRQCDALDGIEDGLVSNYTGVQPEVRSRSDAESARGGAVCRRCRHRRRVPLRRADQGGRGRVHVDVSYPFPLDKGWTSFPGWTTGGESADELEDADDEADASDVTSACCARESSAIRAPTSSTSTSRTTRKMQHLSARDRRRQSGSLGVQRRGGKLIMKVNTTDYTVNPRWVMDYYDKIVQTMGQSAVNEFLRFYVAVGLFHNRNVGRNPLTNALVPGYVDFIAMLDDWVEQGKAPADTQVLSDMDAAPPFTVHATFPMCRYPMYPRYKGSGDPKVAGSYACTRP